MHYTLIKNKCARFHEGIPMRLFLNTIKFGGTKQFARLNFKHNLEAKQQ